MKIRYLFAFSLLFFFTNISVFAFENDNDLKYDVESMQIIEDGSNVKVNFSGWARKLADEAGDKEIHFSFVYCNSPFHCPVDDSEGAPAPLSGDHGRDRYRLGRADSSGLCAAGAGSCARRIKK